MNRSVVPQVRAFASAPGKLVLLGEYAVLDGATALAAAVDRRASVTIQPCGGEDCRVHSDGFAEPARFRIDRDARVCFQTAAGAHDFMVVAKVIQCLLDAEHLPPLMVRGLDIALDTENFFYRDGEGDRHKLGLGSSAALTVALAGGLLTYAGVDPGSPTRLLGTLVQAHRGLQNGRGSGVDIATALQGGVIAYTAVPAPAIESGRLPERLQYLCIWSGRSASTGQFLARVQNWCANRPDAAAMLYARLRHLAAAGIEATSANNAEEFLDIVVAYCRSLSELGERSETDIFSIEHRRIDALARTVGAVYKPCGAGGGDVGLALSTDPDRLRRLRKEVEQAGLQTLGLKIDPNGMQARI